MEKLEKELLRKEKQANDLRAKFFTGTVWLVGGIVVLNGAAMGFYMWSQWGAISEIVMTGWFSATIVEVLGLATIVARYLFRPDPTDRGRDEGDA